MDYEEMLDRAMEMKPEAVASDDRFEIPEADILMLGSKTMIRNFSEICKTIRRDPKHFMKYLSKELAAPAALDGSRLVINSKVLPALLKKKIESYYNEYLYCPQCGKPDTVLVKEGSYMFLKCEACGSKKPVRLLK